MSGFLTGLVRRAAGLPLPVKVSPAAGPFTTRALAESSSVAEQIADEGYVRSETSQSSSGSDKQPTELLPRSQAPLPEVSSAGVQERGEPKSISDYAAAQKPKSPEPAAILPSAEPAITIQTSDRGAVLLPSVDVTEPNSLPVPRQSPVIPVASPQASVASALRTSFESQPLRPAKRAGQELDVASKQASEPHNIYVKIGRVEVRSIQPAPTARPVAQRKSGGFEDVKLARAHLDRNLG